ncbi:MAG: NAD-dependent epimerase/dehydratase family protein [Bacteroidia bacterium]
MIAVSGATGFLGAHVVCNLLLQQKQVKAFKRANSSLSEFNLIFNYRIKEENRETLLKNIHWVEADILDLPSLNEALTGVNEVYHCAALVSFLQKDYDKLMKVNIEGTANMVNISLEKGIKKFCYASSVAALGRRKSVELIDENTHWEDSKLNSNYAISKYKAELEVWRGKAEGLNVCIVNPTVIIGIGDFNKGGNAIIKSVVKGMPFYTHGVNGYVDVEDVANIMTYLMNNNIFGERFITVSECIVNKDLFYMIAEQAGSKKPYIRINKFLAEFAWRVVAVVRLFKKVSISITKETAKSSLNKSFYSNQKIKQQLNYNFRPISQTIKNCCEFLKTHKN